VLGLRVRGAIVVLFWFDVGWLVSESWLVGGCVGGMGSGC
jgi:hypothetical protein